MERFVKIIEERGGEMEFSEFIEEARRRGVRAELWLKAKHAGLLVTRISDDGRHLVSIPRNPEKAG